MAITFVGSVTGSVSGQAVTLDLTALTGGSGSAAAENDIVLVLHGNYSTADRAVGVATAGYTELTELYANDTRDANFSVSWKRMTSTPDTSVVTDVTAHSNIVLAMVFRGVDTTTAIDATTTTATGLNSGIADAPSITPVTSDAVVVAFGLNASLAATALTGPTGYSNHTQVQLLLGGSDYFTSAAAWKTWTSGAEDPGAWSGHTDSAAYSWAAATVALKPAVAGVGGKIKHWNGSWVEKPIKWYTGSTWVEKPLKVYNGSTWVLA